MFCFRFPLFLALGFLAAIGSPKLTADEVIRIMAANLSSGNLQSYDPGQGNRIFQGLDPDITMVQEMNVGVSPNKNTAATYRAWVNANFGSSFSYFVEPSGNIPNGIVSRYPILGAGEWDDTTMTDRDYVWARIDIPGDRDLWAVSVHISSGGGSSQRNTEAGEIRSYIQNQVPAADYLVIGGDFNTDNRSEACITTLSSVVVTAGPYPADQNSNQNTNASRAKPYDWVIPDADLNDRKTALVIGSNTFPNGLVFDSRVYSPLAEVSPVLTGDSGASGMQHMAVMRAFSIPTNNPPLIASAATSTSEETVVDPDSGVRQIVRGKSIGLSVAASDDGGEAALKYTWAVTSGAAVSFSANGINGAKSTTATFPATGDYTLAVTAADVAGLGVSSSVKLRVVQTVGGLAISPAQVALVVNQTQSFTATLLDQFNLPMAGQPSSFTWSATGGGTFNAAGVFTATTAGGPFTARAASGAFAATSSVMVTRADAIVELTNLSQTYDGSEKPVIATTTPAGLPLTISYAGSPTPPINAGSYAVVATIADPNYQGTSSGTLVIAADPWAFWKNTRFTAAERNAGLAADPADPDGDGLANLAEYALGTDPREFTPPLPGVLDAVGLSITFTRPAGLPGIHYFAEASDDLVSWSPFSLEILGTGTVETVRAREPFGGDTTKPRFLRLRFERE